MLRRTTATATPLLEETRQQILKALKRHFREVAAFRTMLELADAAASKWPCARTIALRDVVREAPGGFQDVAAFQQH